MNNEDNIKRITFFSKNPTVCPACDAKFYKEELMSGRGRLIAGELSDELRRNYEPSKKYGEIFPLIYVMTVCPACLFSTFPQDFGAIKEGVKRKLQEDADRRRQSIGLIFKSLEFTDFRDLEEGAASYILALMSYEHFEPSGSPTFKSGLSALRAAWLLGDLHRKLPGENYSTLATLFYRKARFYYFQSLEYSQTGQEPLDSSLNFGPDADKNYGYEGFLFMAGLLDFKYGSRQDPDRRAQALEKDKRIISRLFGSGKASKAKPSAILEKAKDLYEIMTKEIKTLKGEP